MAPVGVSSILSPTWLATDGSLVHTSLHTGRHGNSKKASYGIQTKTMTSTAVCDSLLKGNFNPQKKYNFPLFDPAEMPHYGPISSLIEVANSKVVNICMV